MSNESPLGGLSTGEAVAVTTPQPTQVKRPWRATVRTVFQGVVGLAAILPALVDASGADDQLPLLAGGLAISGALTRIMALPAVEVFLERFVPFLAARPRQS